MKTINQFLKVLNDIADNHLQIGSFGDGLFSETEANGAKAGGLMWAVVTGSRRVSKTVRAVNMTLLFMDLTFPDESNLREVQSDQELIAYDIITLLDSPTYEDDFRINISSSMTPFIERFDNAWTGWALDISIETSFLRDQCAVPTV